MVDVPDKKGVRWLRTGLFGPTASERAEAAEARARRAEENDALDQIGRIAGSSPQLGEVGRLLGDQVRRLAPFDRMSVIFIEPEGDSYTQTFAVGLDVPDEGSRLSGTVVEEAVGSRSGVMASDVSPEVLASRYPALGPALEVGIRAVLAAPMIADGKVVAALVLASIDPGAYSERHVGLTQRVAERIAPTVASSLRYTALQDQVEELETLAEIGRVVGSSPDMVEVFHAFVEKVRTLLPFDGLVVAGLDHETDTGTNVYVSGGSTPGPGVDSTFTISGSAAETVVRTRSGLIGEGEEVEETPSGYGTGADRLRSIMTVPLVSADRVIATLTFRSASPDAYSARDLELAERIAGQVAGAVDRSWLYGRLRQESQEAEILAEIDLLMASPLDIDAVYERFAQKVRTLIPFDRFVVALLDDEAGQGTVAFASGLAMPDREVGAAYEADKATFQELVGVYSGVVATEESTGGLADRFPSWSFLAAEEVRSVLGVPLISKDQVIAALVLCSTSPDAYDEGDLMLARRIGTQIAGVIVNDHLRGRLRRETEEAEVLTAIRRVVSSASVIEDVYDYVAERVNRIVPFDFIAIATIDMEGDSLAHRYVSGIELDGIDEHAVEPAEGTVMAEAIRSRTLVTVQGQSIEEMESRFPSLKSSMDAGLRSFVVTPLLSGDDAVGALALASTEDEAYSDRHLALIERAGFQLAGAMANVRVRTGQVPDPNELAALGEIGRIVSSSVDFSEIYERFADEVRNLLSFDRIVVWTIDLQRQNLVASYASGADLSGVKPGTSFPVTSAVAKAVLSGRREPDEGESPAAELAHRFSELLRGGTPGQPAMLLVPMVVDNETVGMLSLRSTGAGGYGKRELAVAERIAAQIAGVVSNARVYLESMQVEQAVREAVERVDLAVGGSGDGLWDWRIAENEVWWSPRFKELVDYRGREEMAGVHGLESRLHPEDRDRVMGALTDHLEGRGAYDVEYRLRTGSGAYIWVSDRGQVIWDDSGRAVRMSGSLRDMAGAKHGTASDGSGPHDLGASLAMVESFRHALVRSHAAAHDAEGDGLVDHWSEAAGQVARLAHDLETLSWVIDAELHRGPVDLSAMAKSVVRQFRKERPKRTITFSIADEMIANGDPELLRVLMENLLDNAWKYTAKQPRARVEVGVAERDGATAYYVRDDGAGFDMADVDKLFGLFQRLHPADEFEGTGVGLATVHQIVQRHGGTVSAEGQTGHGATFYFTLYLPADPVLVRRLSSAIICPTI